MTSWNSQKHAEHEKAYRNRRLQGLHPVKSAWQGMTTASVQQAAKTAFKAVTWHYRAAGPASANALQHDLSRAFADLLARDSGQSGAADWLDAWMADMPSNWTAQYPVYAVVPPKETV